MGTKEVTVNIIMEEGDVLGATPSENLVITRIQADTLADGKLQEGDRIVKVNNIAPKELAHFYRLVVAASRKGHLAMVVCRDEKTQEVLKDSKIQVPQERIGNLRIRDGFHYKLVTMEYKRGEKVGLGIKDYMNCVVVTKCPDGTMAGQVFKVGDTICDVDNVRVTDKGVAQNLIIAGLKANQRVTMVIASPESPEALKWVDESLSARAPAPAPEPQQVQPSAQPVDKQVDQVAARPLAIVSRDPPSIRVKSDVRRIAFQEIERRRSSQAPPPSSIIRSSSNAKGSKRVSFNSTLTQEHLIVNENPNAPLRPVK